MPWPVQPRRICIAPQAFDRFQFPVTARITLIGGALAIHQDGQTARLQHLHHHGRTRTRQAGYDEDGVPIGWRQPGVGGPFSNGGGPLEIEVEMDVGIGRQALYQP